MYSRKDSGSAKLIVFRLTQPFCVGYQLLSTPASGILQCLPGWASPEFALTRDCQTLPCKLRGLLRSSQSRRARLRDRGRGTSAPVSSGPQSVWELSGIDCGGLPASVEARERIASRAMFQPQNVAECENCVAKAIVHFDFEPPLKSVSGGNLSVVVEPENKAVLGGRFPHSMIGVDASGAAAFVRLPAL